MSEKINKNNALIKSLANIEIEELVIEGHVENAMRLKLDATKCTESNKKHK
jgi:hypothetical protein